MSLDPRIESAAMRLRSELLRAREGGYYTSGWYSYIDRTDIETLVAGVLGPEPEPKRVSEEIVGGIELDTRCVP